MYTLRQHGLLYRLLDQAADALVHAARALRTTAISLDAWLVKRERSQAARHDLAMMNDRELQDIGVSRASVDAIGAGCWTRDFPR